MKRNETKHQQQQQQICRQKEKYGKFECLKDVCIKFMIFIPFYCLLSSFFLVFGFFFFAFIMYDAMFNLYL